MIDPGITSFAQFVQQIGVPTALVVLAFVIYFDFRKVLNTVISEWLVLHFQQKVILAKIQQGQINPPTPEPPPTTPKA